VLLGTPINYLVGSHASGSGAPVRAGYAFPHLGLRVSTRQASIAAVGTTKTFPTRFVIKTATPACAATATLPAAVAMAVPTALAAFVGMVGQDRRVQHHSCEPGPLVARSQWLIPHHDGIIEAGPGDGGDVAGLA
jgi:hypothetical protein